MYQIWISYSRDQAVAHRYFFAIHCFKFSFRVFESSRMSHKPVLWFLFPCIMTFLFFVTSMFFSVSSIDHPLLHHLLSDTSVLEFRSSKTCYVLDFSNIPGGFLTIFPLLI